MLRAPSIVSSNRPPAGPRRTQCLKPTSVLFLAFALYLLDLPGGGILANRKAEKSNARHALFTELLGTHVHDGLVDYAAIKNDPRLARYLAELAATNPAALPTDQERAAYWLNVYNAFTIQLIVENYPVRSINELHLWGSLYAGTVFAETIWHNYEFRLYGGQTFTLDAVEHEILRPLFRDYRHHAALVCAAISCPPLRGEAYEGAGLSEQLNDQMQVWLADRRRNYYDPLNRKLYVSSIFNWFADDFTRDGRELIDVLLPYFSEDTRASIEADRARVRIKYLPYDWGLNQTGR